MKQVGAESTIIKKRVFNKNEKLETRKTVMVTLKAEEGRVNEEK